MLPVLSFLAPENIFVEKMSRWATSPNGAVQATSISQENQEQCNNFDTEIAMIEQRLLRIQKMKQDNINHQSRNGRNGEMTKSEEAGKKNAFNRDIGEDDSSTETGEPEICKTPKQVHQ